MMTPAEVAKIEEDAAAKGIEVALVLAKAKVAPTTWWRWKTGSASPRQRTMQRVRDALGQLTAA